MFSLSFAVLAAAAGGVLAMTPPGFNPGTQNQLFVLYSSSIAATNGVIISKQSSAKPPLLGTEQRLPGKSYAVMMIDIDVPTPSPPQTGTLLHWMQTGLTPAQQPTLLNTTLGKPNIFLLENRGKVIASAEYFGPSPPARTPLAHRYTQLLIDTSNVSEQGMVSLSTASLNRVNFDTVRVLAAAGITPDKVVAGNFFTVTNPGPAQSNNGPGVLIPAEGPQASHRPVNGTGTGTPVAISPAPGALSPAPVISAPAFSPPAFSAPASAAPGFPGAVPVPGTSTTPGVPGITAQPVTAGASSVDHPASLIMVTLLVATALFMGV